MAARHGTGLADGVPDELTGAELPEGTLSETFGYKLKR